MGSCVQILSQATAHSSSMNRYQLKISDKICASVHVLLVEH